MDHRLLLSAGIGEANFERYVSAELRAVRWFSWGTFEAKQFSVEELIGDGKVNPMFQAQTKDIIWNRNGFAFSYLTNGTRPLHYADSSLRQSNMLSIDTRVKIQLKDDGSIKTVRGYDLNSSTSVPLLSCYF